jgi:SAM-dependent methyltransferase
MQNPSDGGDRGARLAAAAGSLRYVLAALPDRVRSRLAGRAPWLPGAVARSATPSSTYDVPYWERRYARSRRDPWDIDASPYEVEKFERVLALCGDGPFERAFEAGCATGAFTQLLWPRCRVLLAVDISSVAIARARRRLGRPPGLTLEQRVLPVDLPAGPFDLIVATDVMYYWPTEALLAALASFEEALAPGGALVCADYTLPIVGGQQTGAEVHDTLAAATTLRRAREERVEIGEGRPYRLDRLEKPGFSPPYGGRRDS